MRQTETVDLEDARSWPGLDVFDRAGEHIERLTAIYLAADEGKLAFGAVRTGLFGLRSLLVPLAGAFEEGGALIVDADKDVIKSGPHLRRDEPLSSERERELYAHYGIEHGKPAGQLLELWAFEPTGRRRGAR